MFLDRSSFMLTPWNSGFSFYFSLPFNSALLSVASSHSPSHSNWKLIQCLSQFSNYQCLQPDVGSLLQAAVSWHLLPLVGSVLEFSYYKRPTGSSTVQLSPSHATLNRETSAFQLRLVQRGLGEVDISMKRTGWRKVQITLLTQGVSAFPQKRRLISSFCLEDDLRTKTCTKGAQAYRKRNTIEQRQEWLPTTVPRWDWREKLMLVIQISFRKRYSSFIASSILTFQESSALRHC